MSPIEKDQDLYAILDLDSQATAEQIKASYRKLALRYHPDKQSKDSDAQECTERFQQIGFAYAVLSDTAKRAYYDRTGTISDGFLEDKDWTAYFKELWTGVVSADTIAEQMQKYRGSDEEKTDVLKYYVQFKGDMNKILDHVECSMATDGPRFLALIEESIKQGSVKRFKLLDKSTTEKEHKRRVSREQKESEEADGIIKEKELASLQQLIQARQAGRRAQLDAIADKIAEQTTAKQDSSKSKQKRKRKGEDSEPSEPSEEEFQKIQQRLLKRNK